MTTNSNRLSIVIDKCLLCYDLFVNEKSLNYSSECAEDDYCTKLKDIVIRQLRVSVNDRVFCVSNLYGENIEKATTIAALEMGCGDSFQEEVLGKLINERNNLENKLRKGLGVELYEYLQNDIKNIKTVQEARKICK